VEVRATERLVSILLVDVWWTTHTGTDDLLEVGYEFCWRPREGHAEVEWFAVVGDRGFVVEGGSWKERVSSGPEAVAFARTCAGSARLAFGSHGHALAAAVLRLAQNAGAWR
jgi:hypothetical protein